MDSNGRSLQAHKVVISAFSLVFNDIIRQATSVKSNNVPTIFFRGISHEDLSSILDFIYQGEACINKERVASFLTVAEDLKIEGLSTIRISSKEKKDQMELSPNDSIPSGCNENYDVSIQENHLFPEETLPSSTHKEIIAENNDTARPKSDYKKGKELFFDMVKKEACTNNPQSNTTTLTPDF